VLNLVGVLLVYFALPLDWGAGPSKAMYYLDSLGIGTGFAREDLRG
jgi:hypothetical protein